MHPRQQGIKPFRLSLAACGESRSSARARNLGANLGPEPEANPRFVEDSWTPSRSQRTDRSQSNFHHRLIAALVLGVLTLAACSEAPAPVVQEEPKAPVETRASVDRAVATTGDIITYTVTVDYASNLEVEVPEPGAEIAGFRITDLGREEPIEADGRTVEERWYKLRADLVGSYVLPPVAVTYSSSPDPLTETGEPTETETAAPKPRTVETVETSAIFVEVESVLPEDGTEAADIRDVKPLRQAQSRQPWEWMVVAAIALIAGLALLLWWRRRPKKVPPPVPAHEIAFRDLNALRDTDFENAEAVRKFYFQISEVVRIYVEGRFGLNATDLTTEEILPALEGLPRLEQQPAQELRDFLLHTDQVKFADQTPTEEDIQNTYEGALGFVETTRPSEEELNALAEPDGESSDSTGSTSDKTTSNKTGSASGHTPSDNTGSGDSGSGDGASRENAA